MSFALSTKLKWQYAIASQVSDLLDGSISTDHIYNSMESPKQPKHGQYALPVGRLQHLIKTEPWCSQTATETAQWIVAKLSPSDTIEKATALGSFVNFTVSKSNYIEAVLQEVLDDKDKYGAGKAMDNTALMITCDLPLLGPLDPNQFRGLVLATFLQRSYQRQGRPVRLMNTMNLWSNEYGYLALAYNEQHDEKSFSHLIHIYQQIKQDASKDDSIHERARQIMLQLEQGHEDTIRQWQSLQTMLIKESIDLLTLKLPFYFDDSLQPMTPWHDLAPIYTLLEQSDKLIKNPTNGEWRFDLSTSGLGKPLIRDMYGLSTRLTRDLIQLIKVTTPIHHIASQPFTSHLEQANKILQELDRPTLRRHVPFGKVTTDTSVTDTLDALQHTILDIMEENEGTERYDAMMAELGQLSMTTRHKMQSETPLTHELAQDHARRLSTGSLMIRQLTQRRNKPLVISGEPDVFGNSGVFLQFVHARLCGIERQLLKRGLKLHGKKPIGIGKILTQPEALDLVECIAQYKWVLTQAQEAQDPAGLVTFCFKLARTTNQALYRLRIKDCREELALARWTLFGAAKQVLANGLAVLGIAPVSQM